MAAESDCDRSGGAGGCGATTKMLDAFGLATASTGCGSTTGCLRTCGTGLGGGGNGLAGSTFSSIIGNRRALMLGGNSISSFLTET